VFLPASDIQVANGSTIAAEAIQRIGALYDIEREIRGKPTELRHQIRQTQARPLIEELHVWMNKTLARISRKSDTAVAIRYALSRWRALTRYLNDGLIELDNSAAERALRALRLEGRTSYSRDRIQVGNAPPVSIRYSGPPSSTG